MTVLHSSYYKESIDPFVNLKNAFAIRAEHLMRYHFAAKILSQKKPKSKVIYDIACGSGYGASILAEEFEQIISMDRSGEYLLKINEKYKKKNITFLQIDLNMINISTFLDKVPFPKPDAIVSFETLEHVDNPKDLIDSFYTLLPPGGLLLLSTPNKTMEPLKNGISKDPFHKHLFTKDELIDLLTHSGFHINDLVGQPYTNLLIHKSKKLSKVINHTTEHSIKLFQLLSKMFGYPTSRHLNSSYSLIVVAIKKEK